VKKVKVTVVYRNAAGRDPSATYADLWHLAKQCGVIGGCVSPAQRQEVEFRLASEAAAFRDRLAKDLGLSHVQLVREPPT